jgi:hypothetical protein
MPTLVGACTMAVALVGGSWMAGKRLGSPKAGVAIGLALWVLTVLLNPA